MPQNKAIKTRIAPSPTGKMHVGTARTALFNYLFAKHFGGAFLVRIEDTDKERSTDENVTFIEEAFAWLALEADAPYVFQSQNADKHKTAAQRLLDEGKAYTDDGALRFKIPAGSTTWHDIVQGEITYEHKALEDFVILRSDGSPTYHLGVVCDDAAMGISHVLRGDDHINNTPKQILLHQALGNRVPTFGHVPLIHGADGKKLSKRNGALSVQELADAGILPAALNNFLLRMGWSHGDDELISRAEAIKVFDGSHIGKGAAVFDMAKLNWFNSQYIMALPEADYLAKAQAVMPSIVITAANTPLLLDMQTRLETMQALAPVLAFLDAAPTGITLEDAQKTVLTGLANVLEATDWQHDDLETAIKGFIEAEGLKFKHVGLPLRLATTGQKGGAGLYNVLLALGKDETLKRIKAAA